MEVRLFATLRTLAGSRSIAIAAADGDSIRSVLERLIAERPALAGEVLSADGAGLLPYVNVFVDGRSVRDLDGLETRVRSTSAIAVFPPVAGG